MIWLSDIDELERFALLNYLRLAEFDHFGLAYTFG